MSIDTRRRLWILGKLRQSRRRHFTTQQGLRLRQPPHRTAKPPGTAADELASATYNTGANHRRLLISTVDEMAVERVEKSFLDDAARAEAMNYLNRTYGPRFVGKMIKHLPNSRARWRPDR